MFQSENINELATALAKAQSKIGRAVKDSNNPAFKSKYADLSSVMDACIAALNSEGLAITQIMTEIEGKVKLLTRLMHTSGQYIDSYCPLYIDAQARNPMHTFGSALTYARRYSLAAICGVAQDDDDGNSVTVQQKKIEQQIACVTPEHQQKIMALFNVCEENFRDRLWSQLCKKYNMMYWKDLPVSAYEGLINHMQSHIKMKEEKSWDEIAATVDAEETKNDL